MADVKTAVQSVCTGNGQDIRVRSGRRLHCALPASSLGQLKKSLKRRWKCYRKQLKRCQKKLTEEAIHDSRVEARRLLSTLELLGGFLAPGRVRKVERALKRHLDTFDDLRDTQVQLPVIRKMQVTFPAARPFCAFLCKREERLAKCTRLAIEKVRTRRLDKLLRDSLQEVETRRKRCPAQERAARLLRCVDRAFERTDQLRARIDPSDTRTIHCTRVAFKKFRYMVETLMDLLPAPDRKLCTAMHDYQTLMGDIQDAEMLRSALEKFLRKHTPAPQPVRHLREELALRRQRLIDTYMSAMGRMREFWPLEGPARPAKRADLDSAS